MKYFIAYKQSEDTYMYVTSIGSKIDTILFYANALDFITYDNAKNVADYLNEYDADHTYIVIEYTYELKEV